MRKPLILFTLLLLALSAKAQSQQEWRDSLSTLTTLIERHPRNVPLRLHKQWQYALDEYTTVLSLDPGNLTALYYRGFVNQHLGRYAFARQDYEQVLKAEPLNSHALMGLILTDLADHRLTQAFDCANHLVAQIPDDAEALAVRAEVEVQLEMIDAAVMDIEKAIKIEDVKAQRKYPASMDDNITSYQLTAFSLYMRQGNKRKARQALDYLMKIGVPKAYLADYYSQIDKKK